jgi:hypothetical protein
VKEQSLFWMNVGLLILAVFVGQNIFSQHNRDTIHHCLFDENSISIDGFVPVHL